MSFFPNSGISQYVQVQSVPRVERSTSSVPSCRHFAHTIRRGKNTSPQFGHLLPSSTGGASGSSGMRKYPSSIGTRAMRFDSSRTWWDVVQIERSRPTQYGSRSVRL